MGFWTDRGRRATKITEPCPKRVRVLFKQSRVVRLRPSMVISDGKQSALERPASSCWLTKYFDVNVNVRNGLKWKTFLVGGLNLCILFLFFELLGSLLG